MKGKYVFRDSVAQMTLYYLLTTSTALSNVTSEPRLGPRFQTWRPTLKNVVFFILKFLQEMQNWTVIDNGVMHNNKH